MSKVSDEIIKDKFRYKGKLHAVKHVVRIENVSLREALIRVNNAIGFKQ